MLSRDVGLLRLLSESVDPASTNAFVRQQIGPIIDHDAAHGTALLQTLAHYLTEEGNKARTAELLGIRRQNLYARLTRIEGLLDVQLSQPEHRLALGAALAGWQLRTGQDPGADLLPNRVVDHS